MTELAPGVSQIVKCLGKIGLVRQRLFKRRSRFVWTPLRQVRCAQIVVGIRTSRYQFKQSPVKIDRLTRASELLEDDAGIVDRVSVIRPKLDGTTIRR